MISFFLLLFNMFLLCCFLLYLGKSLIFVFCRLSFLFVHDWIEQTFRNEERTREFPLSETSFHVAWKKERFITALKRNPLRFNTHFETTQEFHFHLFFSFCVRVLDDAYASRLLLRTHNPDLFCMCRNDSRRCLPSMRVSPV